MNFKFSLICVLIFVLIFTSCSKKSETQTAAAKTFDSYEKILHGDLSAFTGTWVNIRGERRQLRANGTFNSGETAYKFIIGNENDQHIAGTNYQWIVNMGGEAGGFEVWLYPAGTAIRNYDGDFIETDNTKDRIVIELIGSSYDVYYRLGEAPSVQTKTAAGSGSYAKILAGDFSDFAGTWANAYTQNQLFTNGVFVNSSTRSIDGITTGDFNENNGAYIWGLYDGGRLGYEIGLYPAGVQIYLGQNLVVSDTSKDRILIFQFDGFPTNDDVFYKESEASYQAAGNIPSDIAEIIHKRIEAIENGDIAAFRATLAPYEDNSDYNFQFRILAMFFGDLFGINADTAIEALANGDDVSEYARFLFHGVHRPVSRNTGLRITKIEINETYGYNVTVADNRMQEKIISFMFSSF